MVINTALVCVGAIVAQLECEKINYILQDRTTSQGGENFSLNIHKK